MVDKYSKSVYNTKCKGEMRMARPKRFTEKLVVGLTPELKDFLQRQSEIENCDMNTLIRKVLTDYMKQMEKKDN